MSVPFKKTGDPLYATEVNELAKGRSYAAGHGIRIKGNTISTVNKDVIWLGIIDAGEEDGSSGAQEYDNNEYFVVRAKIANDETDPEEAKVDCEKLEEDDPLYQRVTATNLGEQLEQSHTLKPGMPVWVHEHWDEGSPPTKRYTLFANAPGDMWVKITTATSLGDNRWSYGWIAQKLERTGLWQDKEGGATSEADGFGVAYNSIEANNSSTGVQGNSVDIDLLPGSYSIQPVRGDPVVRLRSEVNCDGELEFIFSYENAVQGECE